MRCGLLVHGLNGLSVCVCAWQDYIVRLRDEEKLVDLFQAARTYYQSIQKTNFEARVNTLPRAFMRLATSLTSLCL